MMKQLALAMILIFSLGCLTAIEVSGNQSGVWDPTNNPYQVVGAITVPAGQSLQILAGVEVQIMGSFQITVAGTMQAVGTEADSIRFVNTIQPGLWPGLRFENETQASFVEHISVEYATIGIRCMNSPMTISQSRFDHCEKGMELYAIGETQPNTVTVENCLIENCIQNGILIAQNSAAAILNNEIRYNGTGAQFRAAIQLSNQSAGGSNDPLIDGNHIHHNFKQGISAWDVATSNAINPTITNNIIEYNYTGIYYLQASGYCADNQINNNFIPGDMNSGAGVMVSGITSTPYFERNTISGNYAGLYITNNAMPVLGDLSIYHSWAQGENFIRDNIDATGNNNAIFCGAYPNANNIIKAENNYWDFNTLDQINSVIMDHTDSASLPTIDFDPWLEEVQETVITGSVIGDITESSVRLELVSVATGLVIGTHDLELTNEINWVFTPTEPFYAVVTINDASSVQYGASGGIDEPTIFDPAAGYQINLGEIICSETPPDSWIRIDAPVMQEGLLTYPVRTGFFVYHWNTTEYLYQDGDYLKLYKLEQKPGTSTEIYSYVYPEAHRTWEKIFNVLAGDTWTKRLAFLTDAEPIVMDLDVTAYEVSRNDGETSLMLSYLLADGSEYLQKVYAPNETLFYQRYNAGPGTCYSQMYGAYELLPVTVEPDGSLFPLAAGNSYLLHNRVLSYDPTELVYDVAALAGDPRLVKLYWQPIAYDGGFYSNYKIYRNDVVIASLPIVSGFIQYTEAYPEVPGNYTYKVTAASDTDESEPTNEVVISIVSGDDPIQPPVGMAVWPNPFQPGSGNLSIRLGNNATETATLKVYNLRGQLVRELPLSGDLKAIQSWDLLDSQGRACASGIYLLRLEQDGRELAGKKVVVLK